MITTGMVAAAEQYAENDIVLGWMQKPNRRRVVQAVTESMEEQLADAPRQKPMLLPVKQATRKKLVGFLPAILITAIIAWFVGRLLDWIWDNYLAKDAGS
jgi:hypothetical protein